MCLLPSVNHSLGWAFLWNINGLKDYSLHPIKWTLERKPPSYHWIISGKPYGLCYTEGQARWSQGSSSLEFIRRNRCTSKRLMCTVGLVENTQDFSWVTETGSMNEQGINRVNGTIKQKEEGGWSRQVVNGTVPHKIIGGVQFRSTLQS